MKLFGRELPDRMAEDSLENTFSCVPKVQGKAESLRQKDGDSVQIRMRISSPHRGLFFLCKMEGEK